MGSTMSASLTILVVYLALFALSCILIFMGHIATAFLYFKVTRIKDDAQLQLHLQDRPEFSLLKILFSFRTGIFFLITIIYPPPLFQNKKKRKKVFEFNHIYSENHPNIALFAKRIYQNAVVSTALMFSATILMWIDISLGYIFNK